MSQYAQGNLFGEPVPVECVELDGDERGRVLVKAYERRLPKPKDKTGFELRDEALAELERKRHEWLEMARDVALAYAARHGRVSADDVVLPLPTGAHPSTRGGVFKSRWFRYHSMELSDRPERHAGRITVYVLTTAGLQEAKARGLWPAP